MTALSGKCVVVTRAPHQAGELCAALESRGAVAMRLPTVAIHREEAAPALDMALASLPTYAWAVFTSVNAVDAVLARAKARGVAPDAWSAVAVAAIGAATATALRDHGIAVRVVAAEASAGGLVAALGDVSTQAILLPQSDLARPALARALEARGASVHMVLAYRTVPHVPSPPELAAALTAAHAVTFASPSAVTGFVRGLAVLGVAAGLPCVMASIGPTTSEALRAAGFFVDAEAVDSSVAGLVNALDAHFAGRAMEMSAHA